MNKTRPLTVAWVGPVALAAALACGAALAHEAKMSPGKPHAPVEAELLVDAPLQVGAPAKVRVAVAPDVAVDGLMVEIRDSAGLALTSPGAASWGATGAGEARYIELDLTPVSGGKQRLTALLTVTRNGVSQSRVLVLSAEVKGPVTAATEKPRAAVTLDAAGEPVRSMPAETTIRR